MKPSPNAELVLKTRYYKENEDWDALCKRVSQFISQPNPELESEYFNLINEFWFLPNSPTLMNAGTEIGNTAACFVLDVSDSMDSIMETAKDIATIFRAGGGVGVDMSKLRENGSKVKKTQGVASGSVSFMEIYDTVARVTKQGGVRRAALMGVLRVDHPEILDFITVKNNRTALNNFNLSVGITQEFMEALENNDTYDVISPIIGKVDEYKAKDIFEFIAMNAHKHGEPGLLFLDTINNRNPIPQFGRISATNPCLTGETLVAVADGRNFVSIKELAESGDDVLVYTMDYNGNPVPSMMRRPRLTGYNQPIYKITLDDGSIVRATGNHKFKLNNGDYVRVDELKHGDSLAIMHKEKKTVKDFFKNSNSNSKHYFWLKPGNKKTPKLEHRLINEYYEGKIENGDVVHHIDGNPLNNNISNLQKMTKQEHDKHHGQGMLGKNNPYHRMSDEWKKSFSSHPREKNIKYSGYTTEEIYNHAIILTKQLGRRASKKDWKQYAKNLGLPKDMYGFRKDEFDSIIDVLKKAATELNIDLVDIDPRIAKSYRKSVEMGYTAKIIDNMVYVEKTCEHCGKIFDISFYQREQSFCSQQCGISGTIHKRTGAKSDKATQALKDKAEENKIKQVNVFLDMKMQNGIAPMMKEWAAECKKQEIPHRLGTRFTFSKFSELVKFANQYNHRVVSVEFDGYEDVYNGTVDNYHNFYVAFPENKDDNMSNLLCINNLQCGEQPLLENSACVLGSINLSKISNIDELDKLVRLSVRFLNNSIDVSEYPLDKINQTVRQLRQIGLGVMGWADYLAQRDIPYDSSRAIIEANAIMSRIKAVAHDESVMIAIERNVYIDTIEGKRYNGGLLSIAPTGTISMLADCSSSIEPYFALAYQKNVLDGESLTYINDILKEKLIYYGLWSPEVEQKIIETGSVQDIDEIPENIKQVFKTANEISVEAHIKMQAAFQIHVDSGISKTINMSNDAEVDDVKRAYLLAYKLGCKGITVYRDGSRQGQVLTTNATKSETCPECSQETVLESGCRSCKHCGWSACSIS